MAVDRLGEGKIPLGEVARALVQHLGHADRVPVAVAQRHAQDIARAIAGLPVGLLVEAGIPIGVGDDLGDAGAEHRSGNSGIRRDADFRHALAAQRPREQLASVAIVQKQRRPFGVERVGDQVDQSRQLMIERELPGDRVGDFDQHPQPPDLIDQRLGRSWPAGLRHLGRQTLRSRRRRVRTISAGEPAA